MPLFGRRPQKKGGSGGGGEPVGDEDEAESIVGSATHVDKWVTLACITFNVPGAWYPLMRRRALWGAPRTWTSGLLQRASHSMCLVPGIP